MSVVDQPADLTPASPTADPPKRKGRQPGVWKFVGTTIWGLVLFGALFVGQLAVVAYYVWADGASLDGSTFIALLSNGRVIALSVIMGLPTVLLVLWWATSWAKVPFADYLALRWPSWKQLGIGFLALVLLTFGFEGLNRVTGHESSPGFMIDVLKTARADGALWLLVLAFCVAAPVTEEFFARGFLYRGWSESFLRPVGAILLSSAVWAGMHLQYDLFFLAQVFSIGLLFGVLRYWSGSIWLTVILHGLNNLAATFQSFWLAYHS